MRSILYILFAVGGVLVAIALSMVLLDDEGDQQVQPQSPSIELSQPAADKAERSDKDSGTSLQPPNAAPAAPLTIDLARVKPDGAAVLLARRRQMQKSVFLKVTFCLVKQLRMQMVNG